MDYLVEIDKILAVEKCEELYVNHVFSLVFVRKLRVGVDDLNSNLEGRGGVVLDYLVEIDEILAVEKCEVLYVNHVFKLLVS